MEKNKSKNENENKFNESDVLAELRSFYDEAKSTYAPELNRIKLLDAADSGNIWKALNMKFPSYQILPDTNFISYVKSNVVASIYTVTKIPTLLATSDEDKEIVQKLNIAAERIWNHCNVDIYQMKAGERAALCNLGITQVGWNNEIVGGSTNTFTKGNVALKNIDPIKFRRDPFAPDLDTSRYCFTIESYSKAALMKNPKYREALKDFKDGEVLADYAALSETKAIGAAKNYYTLIIYWVKKNNGDISEYHVINNQKIIYHIDSIKPNIYPFAILNCNIVPDGKLIGTSEPAKIFANYIAYNILDSVAMTAEYKNQNPPKFISSQAGLDIFQFAKYGDHPGRTFIVNGDATKAVHYHEYPNPSTNIPKYKQDTSFNIQMVSGVDGRYTGRDTGSVITTGGVEDMLNRVTLIDTTKIKLYENYSKRLAQLIFSNFINYSNTRKYFVKNPNNPKVIDTITVDFPKISNDTLFDYELLISSDLPKNKARIAEAANILMEKQMQYNKMNGGANGVQLITEEEWLELQDFPFKERMLERMGMQRETDMEEQVAQSLFQYADLVNQGMEPQSAVAATAKTLLNNKQGISEPGTSPLVTGGGGPAEPPIGGTPPEGL